MFLLNSLSVSMKNVNCITFTKYVHKFYDKVHFYVFMLKKRYP